MEKFNEDRHLVTALSKMTVEVLRTLVVQDGELRFQLDQLRDQMNGPFCTLRTCAALMERVAYIAERLAAHQDRFRMSLEDYKCAHGRPLIGPTCPDCSIINRPQSAQPAPPPASKPE